MSASPITPNLAALLDTLHIERAHIVAHSSSANMALQLAADRPERIGSLVLVEPARAGDSWPPNDAILSHEPILDLPLATSTPC